jgi:predicted aldo/keto reductase-like oxidoreductase
MGKTGDMVSALGYGCMRFPKLKGKIDEARTEKQINMAIEKCVNYFDTAFAYSNSEAVLGKILAKGLRNKVFIATKLPLPAIHSRKDMDKTIETQLKRLQTDRIDYYLMHGIASVEMWDRAKRAGVLEFIADMRKAGKINRVGFSFHGDGTKFNSLVDDFNWDFVQIQYNYMDENFQAGTAGMRYAATKGMGVIAMEPLRGGFLVSKMPAEVNALWENAQPKRSSAEWALRWVLNHSEVSMVLSGMNEEAHVEENIRIASEAVPDSMSGSELGIVAKVREKLEKMQKVPCTGCAYCMRCSRNVDIPGVFNPYNSYSIFKENIYKLAYLSVTVGIGGGNPSYASLCNECGVCEKKCPQNIDIRRELKNVVKEMEGWYFKPLLTLVKAYYGITGFFMKKNKTTENN